MVQTANTVFRDFETDGVPASGKHQPKKSEIRPLLTRLEDIYDGALAGGALVYETKADLTADTTQVDNAMAWVLGDDTVANNGIYQFDGASWNRLGDLPYSYIKASNAGAGTANAIIATTSIPIPAADGGALIALPIVADNTASPVTVSFNDGVALTVKTSSGNDISVGGLTAGMIAAGYVSGSTFRLLTDQASAAVLADVEAAADRAEAAAAAVEVKDFATKPAAEAFAPDAAPGFIRLAGYAAAGDKGAALYAKAVSEPSHEGKFSITLSDETTVVWYELAEELARLEHFGGSISATGTANWTALQNAVGYIEALGGGSIKLRSGTYSITLPDNSPLTPDCDLSIIGEEGTTLDVDTDGTAVTGWTFLETGDFRTLLANMRINANGAADDAGVFIIPRGDFVFHNVDLEGTHTDVLEHTVHAIGLGYDIISNSLIMNFLTVRGFRYGLLKGSDDTTVNKYIRMIGCLFENQYANHTAFNSPSQPILNLIVEACHFGDCFGGATYGTFGIMLGCASVYRYVIVGNTFDGVCVEGIHIEEDCQVVQISSNAIKLDGTECKRGVFFTLNNIGDGVTYKAPKYVAVNDNQIWCIGSEATRRGIEFANSANGPSADEAQVADNRVVGWIEGIFWPRNDDNLFAANDNRVDNCTTGIRIGRALESVSGNTLSNCTTGILTDVGGILGRNSYIDCTTAVDSSSLTVSLQGWYVKKRVSSLATSTTKFVLMPKATVGIDAKLEMWFYASPTAWRRSLRRVDYNGTTFTNTTQIDEGAGTTTVSALARDVNNDYVVTLNNQSGAAISDVVVEASATGPWGVAA